MLGKQIKIKNIKKQREFIKHQLKQLLYYGRDDGDVQYRYVGEVLPEVKEYFEKEGFDVICLDSDTIMAETKGLAINLFVPRRNMQLTKEELDEAEKVYVETSENEQIDMDDILGGLFDQHNN